MDARAETRYVSVGDADVAYQVLGDGPADVLALMPMGNNVDLMWTIPELESVMTRLSGMCRLIVFDRRGTGASDSVPHGSVPTWEDLAEDAGTVLEAVGSKRASLLGYLETGPMAVLFAAMHPDRVQSLVLVNTYAKYRATDDYPVGILDAVNDEWIDLVSRSWGSREQSRLVFPDRSDDEEFLDRMERLWRSSVTPRSAAAQYDYLGRCLDVRSVLPTLQVPALVLHVQDSALIPVGLGRYLAANILEAKMVELPGADVGLAGSNGSRIVDEITEFLTGERPVEVDRILANILFTDIVDSTAKAASLPNERWRALLDAHDDAVREQLRRFRGREIKHTGDGFLVAFDGPARAIRCGGAIRDATQRLGLELRMGLHTGECDVRGDDLGGLAVHIAARVGALAEPGEIWVSGTVKDLVVGSGIEFDDRGERELKGVPGSWKLFAVRG